MESRFDKHNYSDDTFVGSRTQKNEQLYKDIGKTELSNYEVKSNAKVLGDNRNNIDIEKLKSILDTHYQDSSLKKNLVVDTPEKEINTIFETKEYDINVVLNKAKEEKKDDYEADKGKKLHDTQYDILKSLDQDEEQIEENHAASKKTSKELADLINTISLNEREIEEVKKQETGLDLFADLKGNDETGILEPQKEDLLEEDNFNNEDIILEDKEKKVEDNSDFFTKSNAIKKKDYEEFEEFEDLEEDTSPIVKIIIFILLVAFLVGIFILVKSFI